MNVNNYTNDWIKESFPLQPITSKFEDFEIFVWFIFSSNWPNEHVVPKRETFFSCDFFLKSIALFYTLFIALLKRL
jgi:hypothetical protein